MAALKNQDLTQIRPGRSLARFLIEWLGIVAAVAASEAWPHPVFYCLCVIWIGARQHALGVLAHDCFHGTFLRGARANETMAAVILWPLLLCPRSARHTHLAHHQNLNTARDPDWLRNRPDLLAGYALFWPRIKGMLGWETRQLALLRAFVGESGSNQLLKATSRGRMLFFIVSAVAIQGLGLWSGVFFYWLVPWGSWFMLTMRVRGLAEHWNASEGEGMEGTQTTKAGWLAGWLVLPLNVGYHREHHLYPGVPWYHLAELHRRLVG